MQMLIVSTLVAITFSTPLPLNPVGAPSVLAEVSGYESFHYKFSDNTMICPGGWDNVHGVDYKSTWAECRYAAGVIAQSWKEDDFWYNKLKDRNTTKVFRPRGCFAKQSGSNPNKKYLWLNTNDDASPVDQKDGVRYAICRQRFETCKEWAAKGNCQELNINNEDNPILNRRTCCKVCGQPGVRSAKKYRVGVDQDTECNDCDPECFEKDDACDNQPNDRTACLEAECYWNGNSCKA